MKKRENKINLNKIFMATSTKEIIIAQIMPLVGTIVGTIVGLIGGYLIAKRKYVFEKIYEQRLMCLSLLYKRIVNLENELKEYVFFEGNNTGKGAIERRISSLRKIGNNFQGFQHDFWREEILLDRKTTNIVNNFLTKYIEIMSKLKTSNIQYQQGDFKLAFNNWDKSFELVKNDLSQIKDQLKEEFKKTLKM